MPLHSYDAHAKIKLIELHVVCFFWGSVQFAMRYPLSVSGASFEGPQWPVACKEAFCKQMRLVVFNDCRFATDFTHTYIYTYIYIHIYICIYIYIWLYINTCKTINVFVSLRQCGI